MLLTPATLNPPTRHASSFSSASIAAPRGSAGDGAIDRRRSYARERRRVNGQILGCPKLFLDFKFVGNRPAKSPTGDAP